MLARLNEAKKNDKGFTLIELLVVIIIIGILAAVAIPLYLNQQKKAEDAAAKSDVSAVGMAVATWYADNDTAPKLEIVGAEYQLDGVKVGNVSPNVSLDASTKVAAWDTWCVAVVNDRGDKSATGYSYSQTMGLQEGVCP